MAREINFGADATDARYRIRDDDPAGGNLLLVDDTVDNKTLLYDEAAGEVVSTDIGIDVPSVSTEEVESVRLVSPDDDMQAVLDELGNSQGGTVVPVGNYHGPNDHSYPLDVPNGVTVTGEGLGDSQSAQAGNGIAEAAPTIIDADGAVAFRTANTKTARAVNFEDLMVRGSIKYRATTNREYNVERVGCLQANGTNSANGRGLEIRNESYLYNIERFVAANCDGAGIWASHDGQASYSSVWANNCGGSTDGVGMRLSSGGGGGGESSYNSLYSLNNDTTGVTGIQWSVTDADINGVRVEGGEPGMLFSGADRASVDGGRVFNGTDGIVVGGDGSNGQGIRIENIGFASNSGTDVIFSDTAGESALYSELGTCFGPGGNKRLNNVSISMGGFENYLEPLWHTRNGGPQDVTTLTVPYFAFEIDDGTNTSSGNPATAIHVGGTWYYMA